jgi:cytochrome P450 family 307 subfamily A
MNNIGCSEMEEAMAMMKNIVKSEGTEIYLKPLIQRMSANLFTRYMSSTKFQYDDAEFIDIVNCFDEVFWEINQGYALDFLPWLKPFYHSHLKGLDVLSKKIRSFIMNKIINPRYALMKNGSEVPEDFLDTLLGVLEFEQNVTENTIIYMMEDFIGGHSAIGEFFIIVFNCTWHILQRILFNLIC